MKIIPPEEVFSHLDDNSCNLIWFYLYFRFMGLGGWNMIFKWLVEAVEAKNYPFLIELLEVIIMCPVDIERLKSNSMPRQIKFLSKDLTVHESKLP